MSANLCNAETNPRFLLVNKRLNKFKCSSVNMPLTLCTHSLHWQLCKRQTKRGEFTLSSVILVSIVLVTTAPYFTTSAAELAQNRSAVARSSASTTTADNHNIGAAQDSADGWTNPHMSQPAQRAHNHRQNDQTNSTNDTTSKHVKRRNERTDFFSPSSNSVEQIVEPNVPSFINSSPYEYEARQRRKQRRRTTTVSPAATSPVYDAEPFQVHHQTDEQMQFAPITLSTTSTSTTSTTTPSPKLVTTSQPVRPQTTQPFYFRPPDEYLSDTWIQDARPAEQASNSSASSIEASKQYKPAQQQSTTPAPMSQPMSIIIVPAFEPNAHMQQVPQTVGAARNTSERRTVPIDVASHTDMMPMLRPIEPPRYSQTAMSAPFNRFQMQDPRIVTQLNNRLPIAANYHQYNYNAAFRAQQQQQRQPMQPIVGLHRPRPIYNHDRPLRLKPLSDLLSTKYTNKKRLSYSPFRRLKPLLEDVLGWSSNYGDAHISSSQQTASHSPLYEQSDDNYPDTKNQAQVDYPSSFQEPAMQVEHQSNRQHQPQQQMQEPVPTANQSFVLAPWQLENLNKLARQILSAQYAASIKSSAQPMQSALQQTPPAAPEPDIHSTSASIGSSTYSENVNKVHSSMDTMNEAQFAALDSAHLLNNLRQPQRRVVYKNHAKTHRGKSNHSDKHKGDSSMLVYTLMPTAAPHINLHPNMNPFAPDPFHLEPIQPAQILHPIAPAPLQTILTAPQQPQQPHYIEQPKPAPVASDPALVAYFETILKSAISASQTTTTPAPVTTTSTTTQAPVYHMSPPGTQFISMAQLPQHQMQTVMREPEQTDYRSQFAMQPSEQYNSVQMQSGDDGRDAAMGIGYQYGDRSYRNSLAMRNIQPSNLRTLRRQYPYRNFQDVSNPTDMQQSASFHSHKGYGGHGHGHHHHDHGHGGWGWGHGGGHKWGSGHKWGGGHGYMFPFGYEDDSDTELKIKFGKGKFGISRSGPLALFVSIIVLCLSNLSLAFTVIAHAVSSLIKFMSNGPKVVRRLGKDLQAIGHLEPTPRFELDDFLHGNASFHEHELTNRTRLSFDEKIMSIGEALRRRFESSSKRDKMS